MENGRSLETGQLLSVFWQVVQRVVVGGELSGKQGFWGGSLPQNFVNYIFERDCPHRRFFLGSLELRLDHFAIAGGLDGLGFRHSPEVFGGLLAVFGYDHEILKFAISLLLLLGRVGDALAEIEEGALLGVEGSVQGFNAAYLLFDVGLTTVEQIHYFIPILDIVGSRLQGRVFFGGNVADVG